MFHISVDVYNTDVAVFSSDAERVEFMRKEGCQAELWDAAAIASTHLDESEDGSPRFSFVIKPNASIPVWAHECSHMADFFCDVFNMPISMEATEVRAYLVQHFMAGIADFDLAQKEPISKP